MTDAEVFRGPFDPVEPSYPGFVQRPLTWSGVLDAVTGIPGAVADAVASASPPPTENAYPDLPFSGDYGQQVPPELVRKIGGAMAEGWRATPPILTPEAQAHPLMQGFLGTQVYGPALSALGGFLGVGNALMYGGAQLANEVTGDPRAGRDALMIAQVAPVAHVGTGVPPVEAPGAGPRAPAPRPQYVSERFAPDVSELDPYHAIGALIRHDIQENPPAAPPLVSPMMKGFEQETAARPTPPPVQEAPAAPGPAPLSTVAQYVDDYIAGKGRDDPRYEQFAANNAPEIEAEFQRRAGASKPSGAEPMPQPTPAPEASEAPTAAPTDQVYRAPDWGTANQGTDQVAATEPPVPQSVGAAASRDMTADTTFGRTAREIKGAHADLEYADLMRTPQPGDARDIIPGATQTKAEIELSPSVSREAKGLRQEFREGFNDHEKDNNEIYHNWIDDRVPSSEEVGTMKDMREARWDAAEKTIFGDNPNGEPVSTADVVDHMKSVLADPVNKFNSYLKSAFKPFMDALTDKNGNPIQLGARELYGVRQEMGRKVKDMATNPDLAHVRGQFGDLIDTTDSTITGGAPDYRTMMDNYRNDSKGINAAERLGNLKMKVTNGADRVITFGAMDRYMKSLWMERHGPNPYAPAKDIPQATWDDMMLLHQRLARSASADELAKTKGSDTTQLMMEMMRKGAIGVAHVAAAKMTGGLGNIAIPYITKGIDERRAQRKVGQHLNPDLSQYPPVVP